jgi:hypothetical protein
MVAMGEKGMMAFEEARDGSFEETWLTIRRSMNDISIAIVL